MDGQYFVWSLVLSYCRSAKKYILSILPVYSEYGVYWDEHLRYFRRAILHRDTASTQYWLSGSDTALFTASTDSMSLFDTALTASITILLAVFRILYVYTAWTPSISGSDTAVTAGTRGNLGGYCNHWQYSAECTADILLPLSAVLFVGPLIV